MGSAGSYYTFAPNAFLWTDRTLRLVGRDEVQGMKVVVTPSPYGVQRPQTQQYIALSNLRRNIKKPHAGVGRSSSPPKMSVPKVVRQRPKPAGAEFLDWRERLARGGALWPCGSRMRLMRSAWRISGRMAGTRWGVTPIGPIAGCSCRA